MCDELLRWFIRRSVKVESFWPRCEPASLPCGCSLIQTCCMHSPLATHALPNASITHMRARACTQAVSHTLVLRSPRSQTPSSELISYTEPHPPFLLIQRGSCWTVCNTSGCIFKGLLLSVSSFINTSSLLLTHFVVRRCRPWKINSQICYKLVPYLFPDGHFTSYHYSNCWTHV